MWRFLAGVASALLLVGAGLFWWRSGLEPAIASAPTSAGRPAAGGDATPLPLAASEKTREEARLARYDKDDDGRVSRDEYLVARRKAFAKLDTDGDGKLSFEEYAVKTTERFTKADADRSGALDATEFLTTRVARAAGKPRCPPTATAASGADDAGG